MINALTIILVFSFVAVGCRSEMELTSEEKAKLDPGVQKILAGDESAMVDRTVRPDGTMEYGLVVRGSSPDDLKAAGINVVSAFGDVMTVRITRSQIKTLARISSVRSVETGNMSYPKSK